MSKGRWALLDRIQATLKGPNDLTTELLIGLANRLEEAIADRSREALDNLKLQLSDALRWAVRTAPKAAADTAAGRAPSIELEAAYMLGQLGFAQMLAAQVAERRPSTEALEGLRSAPYAPYLRALATHELTGSDLAEIVGERVETVSRKLRAMRDLGLVEARREGVNIFNSLSPFARAAIEDAGGIPEPETPVTAGQRRLRGERDQLPAIMQRTPSFARPMDEVRSFDFQG